MEYLKKIWRGDEKLWKTFWLVGLAIGVMDMLATILLTSVFSTLTTENYFQFSVLLIPLSISLNVFWAVGTWRSAKKYDGGNGRVIAAKAFVALAVFMQLRTCYGAVSTYLV